MQKYRNVPFISALPGQDSFIIADMSPSAGAVIRCTIMGTHYTLQGQQQEAEGDKWMVGRRDSAEKKSYRRLNFLVLSSFFSR